MSKNIHLGGCLLSSSDISDLPMAPIKGFFSLAYSITEESNNMGAKIITNDILVDARINLLGEKYQKRN